MTSRLWMAAACALAMGWPAAAIAVDAPTADQTLARYQRAAEIETSKTNHWILNEGVAPHWIAGRDAFWYKQETVQGHRYLIMDAATGAKTDAFDQARVAAELGKAVGRTVDANDLPITAEWLDPAAGTVRFTAFAKTWLFDNAQGLSEEAEPRSHFTVSPDGKLGVISKDHNLWLKDFASGKETQLTTDGEDLYEYGVPPEALHHPAFSPEVIWSPDSKRLFTAQTDDRKVLDLPVVEFAPKDGVRSHVVHYHAALPGDANVPMFRLVVIDVTNGRQTPVRYQTIPAVRMNDSPMDGKRMWWSGDSKNAYFVDVERGEKTVHVEAVDAATGAARELFSETSDSYVELGSDVYQPVALRPLPKANQLVWYSERSGYAHLYLYDLNTGKLIRPLTSGDWLVRDVLAVDEAHRQVFVSIAGRTPGKNPYYQETARVDLDTGALKVLSASDDDHEVLVPGGLVNEDAIIYLFSGGDPRGLSGVSPSGDYFVETVTRADKPSHTVLRDRDGRVASTVEDADASRMPAWWRWPTPVKLLAADGKTEIDGAVFRPSDYDPHKKYPVIDLVYGGPQASYVPKSFANFAYQDMAAIAELGFVVTSIDGRGTVERGRAFHAESYRKAETGSNLEDHIAGIKQLAAADSSIDLSRVGITGFSGGGYMTAIGMFRFGDFYKVGVAGSGNYDQSLFWATWGERYEGYPYGDYYKQQDAKTYAKDLKGKLLIVQGLMDVGVTPAGTFQLEQALQDANKDYDTLLWPRLTHDISAYGKRREWDYFITNLAGETPPHEFLLKTDEDIDKAKAEALEAKPDEKKKDADSK